MLSQVPVGRRVSDTLYLAPGVSSRRQRRAAPTRRSRAAAASRTSTSSTASNVTNQGYGALGSYSIVFGSLGNATPFDFVKEVQVKTGGYEAEFGQSTGGVVNVVTKSGINKLRGSVFGYTRPTKLEGDWTQFDVAERHASTPPARTLSDARRRRRRPDREGHAVLLRRDRSVAGRRARPVRRRRRTFPLLELSAASIANRRTLSYSAKGTLQLSQRAPLRRVVLRRSVDGRQRPAARQSRCSKPNTAGVQLARLRRPQPDRPLRRRARRAASWSRRPSRARSTSIIETPSVNTWRVTDHDRRRRTSSPAASASTSRATAA